MPSRLEAASNDFESVLLVKRARDCIAGKREEPEPSVGLRLRPGEKLGSDTTVMMSNAHIQMRNRLFRRGDETYQLVFQQRYAHCVIGNDTRREVLALVFNRMRIDNADAELKTLSPHSDEFIGSRGIELYDVDRVQIATTFFRMGTVAQILRNPIFSKMGRLIGAASTQMKS